MKASTPILQALGLGYALPKVLEFLGNAFPSLSPRIKKAKSSGYTTEQILSLLHKGMGGGEELDHLTESQIHAQKDEQNNDLAKNIYKTATGAAVGANLGQAIPFIGENLKGLFGGEGTNPPTLPPTPYQSTVQPSLSPSQANAPQTLRPTEWPTQQNQPSTSSPLKPTAPQTPVPNSSQPPNTFKDTVNNATKQRATDIIHNLGIEKTIKNVSTSNKNLEDMASDVINSLTPEQKEKYERLKANGQTKPMVSLLKDYLGQVGKQEEIAPHVQEPPEPVSEKPVAVSEKRLDKGSIAAGPNGEVGEIKSIRNGEALIDDAGKLRQIKAKDLQLPDEHIATTVARLLEIPEIDKSSTLNYWAYDPVDNELFIMYHNGETYKYDEVDEALVKELEEAAHSPKTEGENEFGAWNPEDKISRGATAVAKIINSDKYKRAKKGEPPNKYYRKLRKGYDYWASLRK